MRSRDRECAHHHNGEELALKGKMSIFALFFFTKKVCKKTNKINYGSLHTVESTVLEWIFQVVPRQTGQAQFIQKQFIAPLRQLPTTHNIPLPFPPSPFPYTVANCLGLALQGAHRTSAKEELLQVST